MDKKKEKIKINENCIKKKTHTIFMCCIILLFDVG